MCLAPSARCLHGDAALSAYVHYGLGRLHGGRGHGAREREAVPPPRNTALDEGREEFERGIKDSGRWRRGGGLWQVTGVGRGQCKGGGASDAVATYQPIRPHTAYADGPHGRRCRLPEL